MSAPLWLVLDIGNTQTVAGLYTAGAEPRMLESVRFRTDAQATGDEYRAKLAELFGASRSGELSGKNLWKSLDRAIVSNVVPALEAPLREATSPTPTLFVNATTRRDFELKLPFPEQLGADRLANVAGALTLVRPPFLIVDAGTATTFCLVDRDNRYIGGAIVPGLETGWKSLQSRAAKLFAVELTRPKSSVGNTTETQLQSGVLRGYEALIEGLCDQLIQDAGPEFSQAPSPVTLFATGGCMNYLSLSPRFRVEPELTLKGLLRYGQLTE